MNILTRNQGLIGRWLLAFLGFPIGGGLTYLILGAVDTPLKGLAGGALAGIILGGAQWLALRQSLPIAWRWVAFTSIGLALGVGASVAFVGTGTDANSIVIRAAITGIALGVSQAFALRQGGRAALLWLVLVALAYTIAWPVTSLVIGQNVQMGYVVFGSSGAILFQLITLVALLRLHLTPKQHKTL